MNKFYQAQLPLITLIIMNETILITIKKLIPTVFHLLQTDMLETLYSSNLIRSDYFIKLKLLYIFSLKLVKVDLKKKAYIQASKLYRTVTK